MRYKVLPAYFAYGSPPLPRPLSLNFPGSRCLMGGKQCLLWICTGLYGIGQGQEMYQKDTSKILFKKGGNEEFKLLWIHLLPFTNTVQPGADPE